MVHLDLTVTFTPFNPEGLVYSGHFTDWSGEAVKNKNSIEHGTATYVLRASDGASVTVHFKGHVSTNGSGEVKVEFEHMSVQCGAPKG